MPHDDSASSFGRTLWRCESYARRDDPTNNRPLTLKALSVEKIKEQLYVTMILNYMRKHNLTWRQFYAAQLSEQSKYNRMILFQRTKFLKNMTVSELFSILTYLYKNLDHSEFKMFMFH